MADSLARAATEMMQYASIAVTMLLFQILAGPPSALRDWKLRLST
jgi:hypothetical protein